MTKLPGVAAPFVVVSGTIGAGKSSLVQRLATALGVPAHLEQAELNPFFEVRREHALQTQLWFLAQSLLATRTASGSAGGVVERPPEEHLDVFVRDWAENEWIDEPERAMLEATYAASSPARAPDLLVHLDVTTATALERVRARARPEERDVDIAYLERLQSRYASFVRRWNASPILRVYTDEIDIRAPSSFDQVLSDVRAHIQRRLPTLLAGGRLPWRAHLGDAGLDLHTAEDVRIPPGERRVVKTGVKMHIPEGHVGLIVPRSSLARNHGVTQLDGPGVIDAGYRGDVHFLLYNTDKHETFVAERGERLGQIVIVPFAELEPTSVEGLSPSERGEAGMGSTSERLASGD